MEKKRKADEEWIYQENVKKARVECQDADLFLLIPHEILEIILFYEDPLSIILLSLTSKNLQSLIQRQLTNKKWYNIYLLARKRFRLKIEGTVLDKLLKSAHGWGGPHHVAVFEWDFEHWDSPVTSDCVKAQQDLIAEDEHLVQFPIKYFIDETTVTYPAEVAPADHKSYDETVDYKRLAVKIESKFHQYEIWRDLKPLDEAFHNTECSCLKEETDLALYDANDQEMQSNLDVILPENSQYEDTFEHGWDEDESNSSHDESDCDAKTNLGMHDIADEQIELAKDQEDTTADLKKEVDDNNQDASEESDNEDEEEYDGYISIEQRDKLLEAIATSERSLKLFIHVLSAAVLGHCPAPSCHDSVLIATAKYKHPIVRTGDVLDEVITQLKYATTLDQPSSIISTMICALQKLRVAYLLFLKQGTEQKYPYLSAVYSVLEVEENMPLPFYIGDRCDTFYLDESVNPWTSYFQADFATNNDFETMPDWLSLRHSMLRLMRKAGVVCATPNTPEFAVQKLCEFIHKTLSSIVQENSTHETIDVTSRDMLKAIEKATSQKVYTDNVDFYYENPIVMNSDSEDYSDSESSVDSDWVDEPITDLENAETDAVDENDTVPDDPLQSIVQESLKKCVKHAQFDAKEDPEENEILDVSDEESDSVEDLNMEILDDYWDEVRESARGAHPTTSFFMPKNLTEEAIYYTSQELSEHDTVAKQFIEKYEDDVPFHDMPEDQRKKIIELRQQTNKMIKDQYEEERNEGLTAKFKRMNDNIDNYDSSIRSDADQCKTMIIDLLDHKAFKQTIHNASKIIRSNSVLKSVKIMNLDGTIPSHELLIVQLFDAIASSPSISSLVLFHCQFKSYAPLADLLRKKAFTKFHMKYPIDFKNGQVEDEDAFLSALQSQQSLKDLMLPFNDKESKKIYLKTISALLSQLTTLHLQWWGASELNVFDIEPLEVVLKQPHRLELVVIHNFWRTFSTSCKILTVLDSLNINYTIQDQ